MEGRMGNYNAQRIEELIKNWDDPAARTELTAALHDQLCAKAKAMLHGDFDRFQGATETQSIVHRALTEVLETAMSAPDKVRPNDAKHFIEIVGTHMRFRLLKLAKEARRYVLSAEMTASNDGETGPRSERGMAARSGPTCADVRPCHTRKVGRVPRGRRGTAGRRTEGRGVSLVPRYDTDGSGGSAGDSSPAGVPLMG